MEIKRTCTDTWLWVRCCICACLLLVYTNGFAQPQVKTYSIRNGKMYIELGKQITDSSLDSFITKYALADLGLKSFIKKGNPDSLQKMGWSVEQSGAQTHIISKSFEPVQSINNAADKIIFTGKNSGSFAPLFPSVSQSIRYGSNSFRRKFPFAVDDAVVTFYIRNNNSAKKVMLAGSFNNWEPGTLPMQRTDSGWIAYVKLSPGKYWYKFIVDGNWTIDNDNTQNENDNKGNINSVYYKTNTLFKLDGYNNAKKVSVAGSFNEWQQGKLQMVKTANGWQLPVYLANGTHTYRFVADGNWFADPANKNKLPNEFNDFNSVIKLGNAYTFKLKGYTDAKQVFLFGNFNGWRRNELLMNKTADGWELSYHIAAGNYEYKFIADNKDIADPDNPARTDNNSRTAASFLVIQANYTFRLKNYAGAKTVYLAGDFNNWNPQSLPMQRQGDDWVCSVNLGAGKHLYKLIVDGKWIKDPGNKLWEQNEFNTGNSVIWKED